jgi:hypothetical protein
MSSCSFGRRATSVAKRVEQAHRDLVRQALVSDVDHVVIRGGIDSEGQRESQQLLTAHGRQNQSLGRREERQYAFAEGRAARQHNAVVPGMRLGCHRIALVENEVRDLQRDNIDGA